jgi:hypothetical protein
MARKHTHTVVVVVVHSGQRGDRRHKSTLTRSSSSYQRGGEQLGGAIDLAARDGDSAGGECAARVGAADVAPVRGVL